MIGRLEDVVGDFGGVLRHVQIILNLVSLFNFLVSHHLVVVLRSRRLQIICWLEAQEISQTLLGRISQVPDRAAHALLYRRGSTLLLCQSQTDFVRNDIIALNEPVDRAHVR